MSKNTPTILTFIYLKTIYILQFITFNKERYFSWSSKSFFKIQSRMQLHCFWPNYLEAWLLSFYIRGNNSKITVFSNQKLIKKW